MAAHYPEGIQPRHATPRADRYASWWRLGLLLLVLIPALFGLLGGGPAPTRRATTPAATFTLTSPDRLRNGLLFETLVTVDATRPIADAVIAFPAPLWRDMTINTIIPAPTEEEYADGEYRFHFGPLAPGQRLALKIDGQINPPRIGGYRGRLRLLDGDAERASLPIAIKVIP